MEIEITLEPGQKDIALKAANLRNSLRLAASVALIDIEENEKSALEKIKAEAGDKRGKIKKQLKEMLEATDIKVVRKFWHAKSEDMFMHFLGDRTKVGGFGSETPEKL